MNITADDLVCPENSSCPKRSGQRTVQDVLNFQDNVKVQDILYLLTDSIPVSVKC